MNRNKAILISIFFVMILGVVITFTKMKPAPTYTYYLPNEALEVYLPNTYKTTGTDPAQVFYGDSEVAHIRFGTLKSFQFMETALIRNTEPNITLLEQSTKDNCMYLYYCTITNGIPQYVYIVYVQDSDTTIMLSGLEKERVELIFKNMDLKVIPYAKTTIQD